MLRIQQIYKLTIPKIFAEHWQNTPPKHGKKKNLYIHIHTEISSYCYSTGRITAILCTALSMRISLSPLYLDPDCPALYLNVTFLTLPSEPGVAVTTWAHFQQPVTALPSLTSTMTPCLSFHFSVCHLALTIRVGKKYLIHFLQNVFTISLVYL